MSIGRLNSSVKVAWADDLREGARSLGSRTAYWSGSASRTSSTRSPGWSATNSPSTRAAAWRSICARSCCEKMSFKLPTSTGPAGLMSSIQGPTSVTLLVTSAISCSARKPLDWAQRPDDSVFDGGSSATSAAPARNRCSARFSGDRSSFHNRSVNARASPEFANASRIAGRSRGDAMSRRS